MAFLYFLGVAMTTVSPFLCQDLLLCGTSPDLRAVSQAVTTAAKARQFDVA